MNRPSPKNTFSAFTIAGLIIIGMYFFFAQIETISPTSELARSVSGQASVKDSSMSLNAVTEKAPILAAPSLNVLVNKYAQAKDMRVFVEWAKQHPELGGWFYAEKGVRDCLMVRNFVTSNESIAKYGSYYTPENYPKRQQAFESLKTLCQGFLSIEISDAVLRTMSQQAKQSGDIFYRIAADLESANAQKDAVKKAASLDEINKKIFATKDPLLIERYGYSLNVGNLAQSRVYWLDGIAYEVNSPAGRNMMQAWTLVPCSLGLQCDVTHQTVMIACLQFNLCGKSYLDYIEMDLKNGNEADRLPQLMGFYKRLSEVVNAGDWDAFKPKTQ